MIDESAGEDVTEVPGAPTIGTETDAHGDDLTTLPYVDRDRIGAVGICSGGAHIMTAIPGDRRIKAMGAVSATNCVPGGMTR